MMIRLLAALAILLGASLATADEGVEPSGRNHAGRLVQEKVGWVFRTDAGKQIPAAELAYVRFDARPIPLPKTPLTRTLRLANEQRVTGMLLKVDENKLVFAASWGKTLTLERSAIVGVAQANDSLPILHDDFEADLKRWRIEGKSALDSERAFFGKSSLRLDGTLTRTWQPALRDGAVRLFFLDLGDGAERRCSFEIVAGKIPARIPGFIIDRAGYSCTNVKKAFGPLKATAGWHMLTVDIEAGRLRIYADDACLGQTTWPAGEAIGGMRIVHGTGKLWIDELSVTRKLQPMALPTPAEQDSLWLEQGEQIFGRIITADRDAVTLDAKFGKRSLPWSRLRGILFARKKELPAAKEPEITFRPGPGFPVDLLRAKLVRWESEKLIVDHALLGEIAIERDRLEMVRFAAK